MSTTNDAGDGDGLAEMALMVRSFQLSKMLQVAAALELADRVADGPRSVSALARECDADPDNVASPVPGAGRVRRVLRR